MRINVKKFLPRSLFGRSLLILITPVLIIQVITSYIFIDQHWNKMASRLSSAVAGEIAIIAEQFETPLDVDQRAIVTRLSSQYLELIVSFVPDGSLLAPANKTMQSIVKKNLGQALSDRVRRPYQIMVDMNAKWVYVDIQLNNGLLNVAIPQRRLFSSSGYIFLLWMVGVSLLMLAISILFMRNQIRPIRRLAVVADRFGKGREIPSSYKPEGAHEIRQASHAFIAMQERIKRQIQQRTAMLAGVSHDLRTPLTRMKLQAAMMPPSADVDALKEDMNDMERMLNAYLDFVRGEGGEQSQTTNIHDTLQRIVNAAKRTGALIRTSFDGNIEIAVKPVAFERALANIINNAHAYAKNIEVSTKLTNDYLEVIVDDDGPGISPEKRLDVFKPFYRVESSRNKATGGVGLGLAISQDIVLGHGGAIHLEDSPLGGLRVRVSVPL
jgi:two-component system osmolarity sensor histidine kinase EnvZ